MKRPYTEQVGMCFMFCKVDKQVEANTFAEAFDPDIGGALTFTILELCDSYGPATAPASHYGASTFIDAGMDTDIKATGPTLTKYFSADGWTWETALADMSLQVREITI